MEPTMMMTMTNIIVDEFVVVTTDSRLHVAVTEDMAAGPQTHFSSLGSIDTEPHSLLSTTAVAPQWLFEHNVSIDMYPP